MTDTCSHVQKSGAVCNRAPVVADYSESDPLTGWHWIASLCRVHHTREAESYALWRGYQWKDRTPWSEAGRQLKALTEGETTTLNISGGKHL